MDAEIGLVLADEDLRSHLAMVKAALVVGTAVVYRPRPRVFPVEWLSWDVDDFYASGLLAGRQDPGSDTRLAAVRELTALRMLAPLKVRLPQKSFAETLIDTVAEMESPASFTGWLDVIEKRAADPFALSDSPGSKRRRRDLWATAMAELFADTEEIAYGTWEDETEETWRTAIDEELSAGSGPWLVLDDVASATATHDGQRVPASLEAGEMLRQLVMSIAVHYAMTALPTAHAMTPEAIHEIRQTFGVSLANYREFVASSAYEALNVYRIGSAEKLAVHLSSGLEARLSELTREIASKKSFWRHLRGEATNLLAMNIGVVPVLTQFGTGPLVVAGGIGAPNLGMSIKILLDYLVLRHRVETNGANEHPLFWKYVLASEART